MNVVHVGMGTSGRLWLDMARRRRGITSVRCVDVDASERDWVGEHVPGRKETCFERLADALRHANPQAAIIAGPVDSRARSATSALEAGLAVLVEPPLALKALDAAQVLSASRRTGRPLIVADNQRFAPRQQVLRQIIEEGKPGTVTHVSLITRRWSPPGEPDSAGTSYSQLLEDAADDFASLRTVLGTNPVSVIARCTRTPSSGYRHGSTTEAVVTMESNVHVQYHGTLTANRNERSLWIEGANGAVRASGACIWWRKRGWRFFLPLRMPDVSAQSRSRRQGMERALDQLEAAALGRFVHETTGEDNLWSAAILEAAILSDETGRVTYPPDLVSAARSATGSSGDRLP